MRLSIFLLRVLKTSVISSLVATIVAFASLTLSSKADNVFNASGTGHRVQPQERPTGLAVGATVRFRFGAIMARSYGARYRWKVDGSNNGEVREDIAEGNTVRNTSERQTHLISVINGDYVGTADGWWVTTDDLVFLDLEQETNSKPTTQSEKVVSPTPQGTWSANRSPAAVTAGSQIIAEGTLHSDAILSFDKEMMRMFYEWLITNPVATSAELEAAADAGMFFRNVGQMSSHVRIVEVDGHLVRFLTNQGIPVWTLDECIDYKKTTTRPAEEAAELPQTTQQIQQHQPQIPTSSLEPGPRPKPTPVPAKDLSTPNDFNGKVTGIKLFLNREPTTWIKYYGTKTDHESGVLQYRWYVGRFELRVGFDRKSNKADWVNLSAQPCTQPLTLEEAKEVMGSLGVKNFQPYFEGGASGTWDRTDGAIHAIYRGNQDDDHLLVIETQLLQNSGAVITD